jgi:hypothetical protein
MERQRVEGTHQPTGWLIGMPLLNVPRPSLRFNPRIEARLVTTDFSSNTDRTATVVRLNSGLPPFVRRACRIDLGQRR